MRRRNFDWRRISTIARDGISEPEAGRHLEQIQRPRSHHRSKVLARGHHRRGVLVAETPYTSRRIHGQTSPSRRIRQASIDQGRYDLRHQDNRRQSDATVRVEHFAAGDRRMRKRKWRRRRQAQDVLPVSEYPETVEIARIHRKARRFVGQHTLLQSFVDAQHRQACRIIGNQGIPARVDQPPDLRTRHPQDGRIRLHVRLQIQFRSRSTGIPPHAQPAAGAKLC